MRLALLTGGLLITYCANCSRGYKREAFQGLAGLLLFLTQVQSVERAKIRNALERVYRHREKLTRDIGGQAGTSEFADAVIEEMQTAGS